MKGIRVISDALVFDMCKASRTNSRARQHFNLHQSYGESVQRLLNVIQPGSYIRPHRHMLAPRLESLFVLKGRLVLITFDDEGNTWDIVLMAAGSDDVSGAALGVELEPGVWHTVIALEGDSALLEIKAGPFDPAAAKEPAAWAPPEGSPDARAYFQDLCEQVIRKLES